MLIHVPNCLKVYAYLFVHCLLWSRRYFYPISPPPMRRVCERASQPMRVAAPGAPYSHIITARPPLENQTGRISRSC